MGWGSIESEFRRAGRKFEQNTYGDSNLKPVYTMGMSEYRSGSPTRQSLGIDPKPLPPEPYTSGSPYASGADAWDGNGYPTGPMPRGQYALDWQYEANRRAEARRQALWGDAQNVMRQGADLLQSYRPGGSAALASNIYGQRGSLYGTQAMNTEAPDLLMGYRERKQQEADAERAQAERFARTMGLVQTAAAVVGTVAGGPAGGMAAYGAAGALGAQMAPSVGSAGAQAATGGQGGTGGVIPAPGGVSAGGGGGGGGLGGSIPSPGTGVGPSYGGAGGMVASPVVLGGGGGMAGGSPGGSNKAGGTPGPSYGGADSGGESANGPGGRQGAAKAGGLNTPGPMSTFQGIEAAGRSMASSPASQATIYPAWSEDSQRRIGVVLQASSARERLLRAMGAGGSGFGASSNYTSGRGF